MKSLERDPKREKELSPRAAPARTHFSLYSRARKSRRGAQEEGPASLPLQKCRSATEVSLAKVVAAKARSAGSTVPCARPSTKRGPTHVRRRP